MKIKTKILVPANFISRIFVALFNLALAGSMQPIQKKCAMRKDLSNLKIELKHVSRNHNSFYFVMKCIFVYFFFLSSPLEFFIIFFFFGKATEPMRETFYENS